MQRKIAVLVGSLRKGSYNRKMAKVLKELATSSLKLDEIEIGDLPLYNQDLDDENRPPAQWQRFRDKIKSYDGVLFVTPEYNRSIPGVLKNAIDIGSRPYGQSVWTKKPVAIMSVSPSAIGGFGANQHLRQTLVFLDMPPLQQPEAYMGHAADLFTENGELAKKDTQQFLQKFLQSFENWIAINTREPALSS